MTIKINKVVEEKYYVRYSGGPGHRALSTSRTVSVVCGSTSGGGYYSLKTPINKK